MCGKLKDYDLYFIHIPKNAGTSFEIQFCSRHTGHLTLIDYHPKIWNKTIAIFRNPFDRLVSTYNYYKMKKNYWHSNDNSTKFVLHELYDYCMNNSFEIFVRDVCSGEIESEHLTPQYKYITNRDGKVITRLIRFENIDDDLTKLFNKPTRLLKINSSNTTDYDCYNEELKQLVRKKYEKDFEIYKVIGSSTSFTTLFF
jgi:hypothetical protein